MGSDHPPPSHGDGIAPPPAGEGCSQPIALALVLAGLAGALGVGLIVGRCSSKPTTPAVTSATVLTPTPNVITAIRDLARLESAEFQIERVIDLTDKQTRFFGLLETKDALLLVASGTVVAGVDLSALKEDDVTIDAKSGLVRVRLPRPKILGSRIDNERTYVHTRRTDVLAERRESLETRARQEAERSIVEAAKQGGILQRAEQNTRRTIESLVHSLGHNAISVEFRDGD